MNDVMRQVEDLAMRYPCSFCGAGVGSLCRRGSTPYHRLHGARVDPIIEARGAGVREGIDIALSVETTLVPLIGVAS